MRIVFCPNPACPRGLVWTGPARPTRLIGKCPDCGRTAADPEDLDRERAAEDAYRGFSADCYDAAWGASRRTR